VLNLLLRRRLMAEVREMDFHMESNMDSNAQAILYNPWSDFIMRIKTPAEITNLILSFCLWYVVNIIK